MHWLLWRYNDTDAVDTTIPLESLPLFIVSPSPSLMPPAVLPRGGPPPPPQKKTRSGNKVIIDESKKGQFTALSGLRGIVKKLRSEWTIETNTDEISDGTFINCRLFIIPAPRGKFNTNEVDALRKFLSEGGALMIMLSEGGETILDTNINFFLEEYGIMANSDCVIRTIFYKYFDPKEALVTNGIINRAVPVAAGKTINNDQNASSQSLSFVYPYGCTLDVNRLSCPILSTGSACFPISRPIAAFHTHQESQGKLAVLGSVHMFHDTYIDKEDNAKLFKVFIDFLLNSFEPNKMDAAEPDLVDYYPIPDHVWLSDQFKVCLSEGEMDNSVIDSDFMKLFDSKLTSFDFTKWPKVLKAYDELNVKAERLSFIIPNFEVPILKLQPAVFPPNFRELPPPELELFDLDDMFSSKEVRLAQLMNKCEEKDLEYFIREAGDTVDISSSLPVKERTARRILEKILQHLVEYKKNNLDDDDDIHLLPPDENLFDMPRGNMDVADFSDLDDYDD